MTFLRKIIKKKDKGDAAISFKEKLRHFQNLLNSWIIRFNDTYLKDQTYFNPYPEELMNFDLTETWRGRSYWQ